MTKASEGYLSGQFVFIREILRHHVNCM
jgi:hypothetical protein